MKKTLLRWARVLLGVYALVLAGLYWRQEVLLFRPHKLAEDHAFTLPADVKERWVEVEGGRLNALHLQLPQPDGVVFFLHGNGGSLQNWFVNLDFYRRQNFDLFMIDYRGYGKSPGQISSEAQLMADVRAAWQAVAPGYAAKRQVFFGRSLGTGPAAQLAAELQPDLTILVSPYFSMQRLAAEHYAWVPSAVLRYPLRTDLALPRIRGPVLLVHGEQDTLIPPAHSQALKPLATNVTLAIVPGAGHNDLQGRAPYTEALATALSAIKR
jgi:pimeloyl-ACP methyl ester carboxylesterase